MTPVELNDLHHSSARVLQNRDYIDSIEGPHQAKEDSKEEDVKVMIEEVMDNDPDQQKNQGYQSYIVTWFQTVTKLQKYSLL